MHKFEQKTHKFRIGQCITAKLDNWGNWGNGSWFSGEIVTLCFLNGKPAYDIKDKEGGHIVFNILEERLSQ
jgi:hypothetical protein